jgi:glutaredoxin 3
VPQILIDGKCIGGFTELTELHMEGGLDELVEASKP